MKSVLLTRSVEGNKEIISSIDASFCHNDFSYIHCPLIRYQDLGCDPQILMYATHIIVTSKYAAKIVASWFYEKNNLNTGVLNIKKIWAVGESCIAPFGTNHSIPIITFPNIQALMQNFPPTLYEGSVYLSSNEITCDLPPQITRHILYQVTYENELPQELFQRSIDYILLYSQNSAKTLLELLIKNNLQQLLDTSLVIAISKKVADIMEPFTRRVMYASDAHPNQILDLLIDDAKAKYI